MEKRIRKIIQKEGLNVNQFSKIIGVNRSTLSHILSGRNKPSVDVLEKILDSFPSVNANWLLSGLGKIDANLSNQDEKKDRVIDKIVVFYSDNSFEELKP